MQDRAGKVKPRLVFVHGIGGSRDSAAELALWKRHLADGFRAAGHGGEISALTRDWAADSSFAHYGDLFADAGAQSGDGPDLDEEETRIALGLLAALLDEEATVPENLRDPALRQLAPEYRMAGLKALAAKLEWSPSRFSHHLRRMHTRGLADLAYEADGQLAVGATGEAARITETATLQHAG
ncbi:hypothetical protein [Streptomyces sp. NPDC047976]|uniref:hypothetical protein n=1 Tax=Streptomyces sp. NPDC047976 TaxID=3155746 RepID=UPI00341E1501